MRRATALVIAAAAALAAGCGPSSSTTVTSNATPTATTPTSHVRAFSSPTGNIGCVMNTRSARCDIKDRSWRPPPAPANCPLDYGQGVEVSGLGKATLVCAGDTALGASRTLAYGTSSQVGAFICTSATTAMKCGNSKTGHGFELSRESYDLF